MTLARLAERYTFLLINPRTLAPIAEVPPAYLAGAKWERRQFEPGPWSLVIPRALALEVSAAAGVDAIARQNMIEIRRDGAVEYRGYIVDRGLDPSGQLWTLAGYDLKEWWHRRIAGRSVADARAGTGETVLKGYVDDNLGPGAGARAASGELAGKTFTIEADAARGLAVEYSAQRVPLARVIADICRQAGLLADVVLTDDGLEFRVTEPEDHTSGTGAVPFAISNDNVEALGWREAYGAIANALTVAGEGSGDTRLVHEVEDAVSIGLDFRREGVFDAKAATTIDQLEAAGQAEIQRQLAAAVGAEVVPLTTSGHAEYHTDFEVGWDITAAIPAAGVSAIDRRVAAITVTLDTERGERISLTLGTERPTSTLRRIGHVLENLQQAVAV